MSKFTPLPSIKNTREIRDLAMNGRRFSFEGLTVYQKSNAYASCRVAVAVRKKTGNAVVRNLIKRRIKDTLRLYQNQFVFNCDLLIVVNPNPSIHQFALLQINLMQIFKKLSMINH